MQLFVEFGSYKLGDQHFHITTHSIHFFQPAFMDFWCLQVISFSCFSVINFLSNTKFCVCYFVFMILNFMASQGRDWEMDCSHCCCITTFCFKTPPWYVQISLYIYYSVQTVLHHLKVI